MGIYIKGMEMPTDKIKNIIILSDGQVFQFSGYGNPKPLGTAVPIPPHGRLIDADALQESTTWGKNRWGYSTHLTYYSLKEIINAPTVIPAEKGE